MEVRLATHDNTVRFDRKFYRILVGQDANVPGLVVAGGDEDLAAEVYLDSALFIDCCDQRQRCFDELSQFGKPRCEVFILVAVEQVLVLAKELLFGQIERSLLVGLI